MKRTILVALAMTMLAPSVTIASDTEADVIARTFGDYLTTFEDAGGDIALISQDDFDIHLNDAMEVWLDTKAGSDCETYAAIVFNLIFYTNFATNHSTNDNMASMLYAGLGVWLQELDTLENQCRNEF